jgi:hypothetical protein
MLIKVQAVPSFLAFKPDASTLNVSAVVEAILAVNENIAFLSPSNNFFTYCAI